jgi:signal transduction histidine kinase
MAANTIPLTEAFTVPRSSCILYEYTGVEQYVVNAVSYIRTGLELGQSIIYVDEQDKHDRVRHALEARKDYQQVLRSIHYVECVGADLNELNERLRSIMAASPKSRLWVNIDFIAQAASTGKLTVDNLESAIRSHSHGEMIVCACDGTMLSGHVQTELLKKHAYFMTDEQLVPSHMYRGWQGPAAFPSLADHMELRSESDLYKHMLDFVHEVSHEVRNPLTVIRAYAGMLKERVGDPEDRRRLATICDYVDLIHNEIAHLVRTEQLLSTDKSWERTLLSPKELLQEAAPAIALKARSQDIRFHCRIDLSGDELVLGNAQGFKLIVTNLAENAIKYSDADCEVRVEAAVRLSELVLIVSDEGSSMEDTDLRRLVSHIGQLHQEQGRGCAPYGIGLYIVKKLVDHFGGVIEVENRAGVGKTVTVKLPLTAGSLIRLR